MGKFLHRTRRKQLIRQHKGKRDRRIRDCIKAVLFYDKDYTYSDIAETLLVADETVDVSSLGNICQNKGMALPS